MVRQEKVVFARSTEPADFVFVKPLTVVQAINLKSLLCLYMASFCQMYTIFLGLGYLKPFRSELKMKQLLNTSVTYLHEAEMSAESKILQVPGSDEKMIYAPVLQPKLLLDILM